MSVEILMPALSPTMEKGKLARWLKQVGDEVKSGDIIAEIETDKATMEVPSPAAGKVKEIKVAEGDRVGEGTLIIVLEDDGAGDAPATEAPKAEAPNPLAPNAKRRKKPRNKWSRPQLRPKAK